MYFSTLLQQAQSLYVIESQRLGAQVYEWRNKHEVLVLTQR